MALINDSSYTELKDKYDKLHSLRSCTKHFTYDSVFYIIPEKEAFRVIRFYDGGMDYRDLGTYDSPGVAYSEVMCGL